MQTLDEFEQENDMDAISTLFGKIADSATDLCNRLNQQHGVSLRVTTSTMPLQIQGVIDDKFAYIRERHGDYYFEISDSNQPYSDDSIIFSKGGEESIEIMVFVHDAITEYRKG